MSETRDWPGGVCFHHVFKEPPKEVIVCPYCGFLACDPCNKRHMAERHPSAPIACEKCRRGTCQAKLAGGMLLCPDCAGPAEEALRDEAAKHLRGEAEKNDRFIRTIPDHSLAKMLLYAAERTSELMAAIADRAAGPDGMCESTTSEIADPLAFRILAAVLEAEIIRRIAGTKQ